IDEWFAQIEGDLDAKLDNYLALVKETISRATQRREMARGITDLARVDEALVERLKARLLYFFQRHNLKRKDLGRGRITRAKNGGKTPLEVDQADARVVPPRFQRRTITLSYCPADLSD